MLNIRDYLQANEFEAFKWANKTDDQVVLPPPLEPTKAWRIARWYNTLFPVTSVIPMNTVPAESDGADRIDETHLITIETEVDGNDQDKNASVIMRRLNAYDALLRKITGERLFAGFLALNRGGEILDIGRHGYEYFASSPTIYKTAGNFQVTIRMIEGRT